MIESIKALDTSLFLFLNGLHSPFWDGFMFWVSYKFTWIPLYVILLLLIWKHFKNKVLLLLPIIFLLALATDQLSVHAFKNVFLRYRPCHNLLLQARVHLNDGCGGTYGFVSSHAANTFALALFLSLLFRERLRYFPLLMLLWASVVSYSRIYNGVHYPADVLGGAIVGCVLAWIFYKLYRILENKFYAH